MTERVGDAADFAAMFGAPPEPEAESQPDETEGQHDHADQPHPTTAVIETFNRSGKDEWARRFVNLIHPSEEAQR